MRSPQEATGVVPQIATTTPQYRLADGTMVPLKCATASASPARCPDDGQTWAWHQHTELGPDGRPRTNAVFIGCNWPAPLSDTTTGDSDPNVCTCASGRGKRDCPRPGHADQ